MYLMNHGVKVFRKQKTGTGLNSEYVELKAFQRCLVMPMDEKASAQNGFEIGKGFNVLFPPDADIKTGDKLEANFNSLVLYVGGVRNYNNMPPVSHLEASCTTEKA